MSNQTKSWKKYTIIRSIFLFFALVLVIGATIASVRFENVITMFFGGDRVEFVGGEGNVDSEYFKSIFGSKSEATSNAQDLIEQISAEGIVLLKNSDNALPLAQGSKLSVFGRTSVDMVYGGTGSGHVSGENAINLQETLTDSGFELNNTLTNFYNGATEERGEIDLLSGTASFKIGEVPLSKYTAAVEGSYDDYNDAAIVVFGRVGGEGADFTRTMLDDNGNPYPGSTGDQHYLELNNDEIDLLNHVTENFDNVIILINSAQAMELGFLDDYPEIKAALWIGLPGDTGLASVGPILTGDINPSGRLVDTYAYDMTKDPTYMNFGHFEYSNHSGYYFVNYVEGIYVGYRYYETRFLGDEVAYNEAVQFPFGHGLSYTSFDWNVDSHLPSSATGLTEDGQIEVSVTVTNTGSTPGKDVVQLYFTPPYIDGEIEKSHVVLGAFGKTGLLQPGESEVVTLTMDVRQMASYDWDDANGNGFKGWELDPGDYEIKIMRNANQMGVNDPIVYTLSDNIQYPNDSHTDNPVGNLFDDVSNHLTQYLSRSDWEGTWPTEPTESDLVASSVIIDQTSLYRFRSFNDRDDIMPIQGQAGELELIQLRGLAITDPLWQELLNQVTVDEMVNLISIGGYRTSRIDSISKPPTVDPDGPVGFTSFMNPSIYGAGFMSTMLLAATWNEDLAIEMGEAIGEEGLQGGYNGWYAPGMNIHRSPFSGRNFEYYSEDGFLSGIIGSNVVKGAMNKGMYTYIKHFALNDQETNRDRNGLLTWSNEQAMRELYFTPFEMSVKEGGSTAVMSSFNRIGTTWAGGSDALLNQLLRDEWGFNGMVITDYNNSRYMSPDQAIRNGGDLMLTTTGKSPEDTSSATSTIAMRNATHNILYTVVNSNAMNGISIGTEIRELTPYWVYGVVAFDVIGLSAIGYGTYRVVKKARKLKIQTAA